MFFDLVVTLIHSKTTHHLNFGVRNLSKSMARAFTIDFLNRSKISYAIALDPIISRSYLEQFWDTDDHDYTLTPNAIRATVAGHDIAISEDTIRRVLLFTDLSTDLITYPGYFIDGCWRQRMGYVGKTDYASYKKMWVRDQWCYFSHVMIMCISARKAGKDVMGHDLAAAKVGLSLNKGYNFFNVEPTPEHTPLFGHPINEAYVAPPDFRWYNVDSEPELSEHSDEQVEEEEEGDEGFESDGSGDGDQSHHRRLTKVSLPGSSSKRQGQESTDCDCIGEGEGSHEVLWRWLPLLSQRRISTLETQVAGLLETVRKSREESEAQQVCDMTKMFAALGEKIQELLKEKEKPSKPSGDEACHLVDLTKDDDKDKDPEAGPSGSEQQALAIVPISAVSMAERESAQHEVGGDASGSGDDKGKSVSDVLYHLPDEVILMIEPHYSKETQIDALSNLEE
ncbi:hypothetical protein L1987_53312 [Smallanthus sonchifolius]|uniref:Uncharacterized protein n=1 Tax=Smallanthus sonchifolius TaxID=185202 RepID=A0ACB9EVN1_9ASTR|nr:hypothetical protein L1987_53312 [Smallanthus sonchifolius]